MEDEVNSPELFDKKAARAFRTIAEVSAELNVPAHVLRFWEKKFLEVAPVQRAGGRRYYRPEDVVLLKKIEYLLHKEGYTIKGVQKLLKEGTINEVVESRQSEHTDDEKSAEMPALIANTRMELDSVISELEEISTLLKRVV